MRLAAGHVQNPTLRRNQDQSKTGHAFFGTRVLSWSSNLHMKLLVKLGQIACKTCLHLNEDASCPI